MKVEKAYLENKFSEYNAEIFGGALEPVEIRLSNAKSFLGKLQYRYVRGIFGKINGLKDAAIRINTRYDLSEEEIQDTLIHEMIHWHIVSHRIKDTSTHGKLFREMMDEINSRFGRHVTVSHRKKDGPLVETDPKVRECIFCVSQLRDGRTGLTVVSQAGYAPVRRSLRRMYPIAAMAWYRSCDPYFNRFPRSRTPKVYLVDPAELDAALRNSEPLR